MNPLKYQTPAFIIHLSTGLYTLSALQALGRCKINAGSDYPTFTLTLKHGYNYNDTLSGH